MARREGNMKFHGDFSLLCIVLQRKENEYWGVEFYINFQKFQKQTLFSP